MAKPLIIHAGLPKTGTTYLQQCLAHNAGWLRSNGACYPVLGREFLDGHHNVARALAGGPEAECWREPGRRAWFQRLLAEADGATVVLSSEEFSALSPAQIAELRDACGDVELRWVLYLRRRSDLLISRWKQNVRSGLTETLPSYVGAECVGQGDVLRPELPLTAAVEALGRQALRVVVYEQVTASGEDLFDHFLRAQLGVADTRGATRPADRPNASIPLATAETLRVLNAAKAAAAGAVDPAWSRRAQERLQTPGRGRDLVAHVEALLQRHGVAFDVGEVDDLWRSRDFEIVHGCGDSIEQLQPDGALFPGAAPHVVATLPAGVLQMQLPLAEIRALIAEIDATP